MRSKLGQIVTALALIAAMTSAGIAAAQDATPSPGATPVTDDPLASMPLEVKVGQMIIAGVTDTEVGDDSRHIIADLHIGNIILMGRNFDNPEQVLALTQGLQELALEANGIPLLIGTDQEGGLVQRANYYAGFTPMPPAELAGATQDSALMERYGQMSGSELAAVGVGVAFAPVLDVNDVPNNPVIGELGRSFGTTVEAVGSTALPFLAGLEAAGVVGVGKHFPGHGSTTSDSHLDLPYVRKDRAALEAVDLAPFVTAIEDGIPALMTAHVVYTALDPDNPATLSHTIMTGLLRDEFGFEGVVFTDDLGMAGIMEIAPPEESAVLAVLAGADIVTCVRMDITGACAPDRIEQLHAGLMGAVKDGRISEERINESVRRILALKEASAAGPASGDNLDVIQSPDHFRVIADIYDTVADRREEAP